MRRSPSARRAPNSAGAVQAAIAVCPAPAWAEVVGRDPRHQVAVREELGRGRRLYLWWKADGPKGRNNRCCSLGTTLYDEQGRRLTGKALKLAQAAALAAAEAQYARNAGHAATAAHAGTAPTTASAASDEAAAQARTRRARLARTLAELLVQLQHPVTGPLRTKTPYNDDLLAAWKRAVGVWGAARAIGTIEKADFVALWRAEMARIREGGGTGYAGAAATVRRVVRALDLLRDLEVIDDEVAQPPHRWQAKLARDFADDYGDGEVPVPSRRQYTLAQLRALLRAAPTVDPRVALAMQVGAELRPGQVVRTWRSAVRLPALPCAWADLPPLGSEADQVIDYGTVRVAGRGKKGGATVELTRAQRAAFAAALHPETGYLRELEAGYQAAQAETAAADPDAGDYPLFPAGRLTRRRRERPRVAVPPVMTARVPDGRGGDAPRTQEMAYNTLRELFTAVERAAAIPEAARVSWYGMRRATTTEAAALELDPGALQSLGGWSRVETPLGIYREQGSTRDRRKARDARSRIRGDGDGETEAEADRSPRSDAPRANGTTRNRKQPVNSPAGAHRAAEADAANLNRDNDV